VPDELSQLDDGSSALRPGLVVGGKFTLLRLIARGGVGAVYEAEDALICRRVALKLLQSQYAKHPDIVRRFFREAQATAAIDHPHVVTIHEMGSRRDGSFFIVQELLKGANLRELLGERRRLPLEEALQIVLPITDALAAAHRKGIVHRDVKPENIVLARTSSSEIVPKLVDFGVAKMRAADGKRTLTKVGVPLGTTAYMSPEQARGDLVVDGRADVWGLGVVLFEALSGRCPYDGPNDHAILVQILTGETPDLAEAAPSVPRPVVDIVRAALERDAQKRPTMQALRERLLAFVATLEKPLPPLSPEKMTLAEDDAGPPSEIAPDLLEEAEELSPEEFHLVDDERPAPWKRTESGAGTVMPEMEWEGHRFTMKPEAERVAAMAEDALRINALEDALARASEVVELGTAGEEVTGRMLLMQSIASHWLGNYLHAETYAQKAMEKLPPGTTGWYAALGHVAMAGGAQGHTAHFDFLLDEIQKRDVKDRPAQIVGACRLAVQLVRAGSADHARELIESSVERAGPNATAEPFVRAWLAVARGELAVHEGDPMKYMALVKEAVDDFVAAGDIRNASLQRSNIGNAYLQLGGYKQAARILEEALSTAEPMKLSIAATIRANMGFALARLDELDEALAVETAALEQCTRQGNRRFEGVCLVYIATIHEAKRDFDTAEKFANEAVRASENVPAVRAYALALLADLLLCKDRVTEGLLQATYAMDLLEKLDGVEEGESLIRLVHASAVARSGDVAEAARFIGEARARLIGRADRITDSRWRDSFLRNVPENSQTLALARLWGAD
jgi:serine/threonine protein kinase